MDAIGRTEDFIDWWNNRVKGQNLTNPQFEEILDKMVQVCPKV